MSEIPPLSPFSYRIRNVQFSNVEAELISAFGPVKGLFINDLSNKMLWRLILQPAPLPLPVPPTVVQFQNVAENTFARVEKQVVGAEVKGGEPAENWALVQGENGEIQITTPLLQSGSLEQRLAWSVEGLLDSAIPPPEFPIVLRPFDPNDRKQHWLFILQERSLAPQPKE